MATRSPSAQTRRPARTTPAPLVSDELVRLDNVLAEAPVPDEIGERLRRRELHVTLRGDSRFEPQRDAGSVDDVWTIPLPDDAILGIPGQTTTLRKLATGRPPTRRDEPGFRPAWVDHVWHPRLGTPPPRQVLRRKNGRRVEAHSGVYPPDDRQVFYPVGYPWHCVGTVHSTQWHESNGTKVVLGRFGSGVLIGGRVILTAGHVVPWGAKNWKMSFVPGSWDGESVEGPGAVSWVSDCVGWNTGGNVAAHDMAVCRLYNPLGNWLGYLGARTYHRAWQDGDYWMICGYPGAIANGDRPSFQSWIAVLDDDADGGALEIEHHGDTTSGDSGGPMFGFWNDGPYAIGTVSGSEVLTGAGAEDNNIVAGGGAMVDLVRWARQTWA